MGKANDSPDDHAAAPELERGQCDVGRLDTDRPRAVPVGERAAAADVIFG